MNSTSISEPTLVDVLADRITAEDAPVSTGADPYAAERSALVQGLRDFADWWEWHAEIPPPTYPDFTISVSQSGDWSTDDAEGIARMQALAAALGSEIRYGEHLHTERPFAGLRVRAYFITEAAR